MEEKELDGAKLVAGAVVGLDYRVVVVNDKSYIIHPPTIHKIAGATYWLCEMKEGRTIKELLLSMQNLENSCKALSWMIQGDETLTEELALGDLKDVVSALEVAFSLLDTGNFLKLSALVRSAKSLIAKQR